ncbi:unnamed protein product [Porites evermanni]|uniref:Cystatin domain-containing protein n=1 Tax=Porites evermanni TaxID=104178 RepID=A0ABN8LWN3_9CNID|nr:unnamed protein product [Porites evermanni]
MSTQELGCGAWGNLEVADGKVQKICDQVKPKAEEMAHQDFPIFESMSYRSQLVAGTNYLIKVFVNNPRHHPYVLLRVYQSLKSTVELIDIKTGMTKDDPIDPSNF